MSIHPYVGHIEISKRTYIVIFRNGGGMNILVKHDANAVSHYLTNPCMFFFQPPPWQLAPCFHLCRIYISFNPCLASIQWIFFSSLSLSTTLIQRLLLSLSHSASSYMVAFFNFRGGSNHLLDGLMRIKCLAFVLKMMRKGTW